MILFNSVPCVWTCFHKKNTVLDVLPYQKKQTTHLLFLRSVVIQNQSLQRGKPKSSSRIIPLGEMEKHPSLNLRKSSGGFKIIRKIRPHHLQVKFHFSWLKITRILLHRKCKLAETELKSCDVTTLIGNFPKSAKKLRELQSLLEHRDFWVLKQKPSSK